MANLAVLGGKAVMKGVKIPKWPVYSKKEESNLKKALSSRNWCRLFPGSWTEIAEKKFAKWNGSKYAIGAANGTVTLILSLRALGVKAGDEVLVPAITFIASASAITEVGAIPIFVDSDPDTLQMSAQDMERKITPRTKAVLVVHYGGYPVDFDKILPVVKKHNLVMIEDCAHAQGTEWNGKKVGNFGSIGSFSLQNSKSLTCGEGGLVVMNDEQLYNETLLIYNIGRIIGKKGYSHYILSSNYRLGEFLSAVLVPQIERMNAQIAHRQKMGDFLAKELHNIGGLEAFPRDKRVTQRGYYFFVMKYNAQEFGGAHRDVFIKALNAEGLPCYAGYGIPLYKNDAFRKAEIAKVLPVNLLNNIPDYEKMYLPVAEKFCAEQQVVMLHHILLLDKKGIQKIADSVAKIKRNIDELKKVAI